MAQNKKGEWLRKKQPVPGKMTASRQCRYGFTSLSPFGREEGI